MMLTAMLSKLDADDFDLSRRWYIKRASVDILSLSKRLWQRVYQMTISCYFMPMTMLTRVAFNKS